MCWECFSLIALYFLSPTWFSNCHKKMFSFQVLILFSGHDFYCFNFDCVAGGGGFLCVFADHRNDRLRPVTDRCLLQHTAILLELMLTISLQFSLIFEPFSSHWKLSVLIVIDCFAKFIQPKFFITSFIICSNDFFVLVV